VRYIGRFAPSPTGPLHFGSLLAAVGSYLQARTAGGAWLLRIEDLDRPRVVAGADQDIIATLAAFGFQWDGAIEYQSRRLDRYRAALQKLRDDGRIFACTCSRAQIAAWHAQQDSADAEELRYPGTCRERIVTAATTASDVAMRFMVAEQADDTVEFIDRLQGLQRDNVAQTSGDFVVRRRDGIYAYHLAVVVDDALQGVTEVVRGADLLASTPRHLLLQRALGIPCPTYCHLPLALDQDGRKLSKSSQSLAVDPCRASSVLWTALSSLRQSPPEELNGAPLHDLWDWAQGHWSLTPLQRVVGCRAPAA